MVWEKFERIKERAGIGPPKISIYYSTFALNGSFVKWAKLKFPCYVIVYIDEKKKRIGFKFHEEYVKNAFRVSAYRNRLGAQFTNVQIKNRHSWIKELIDLPSNTRCFIAQKEDDIYFVEIEREGIVIKK